MSFSQILIQLNLISSNKECSRIPDLGCSHHDPLHPSRAMATRRYGSRLRGYATKILISLSAAFLSLPPGIVAVPSSRQLRHSTSLEIVLLHTQHIRSGQ